MYTKMFLYTNSIRNLLTIHRCYGKLQSGCRWPLCGTEGREFTVYINFPMSLSLLLKTLNIQRFSLPFSCLKAYLSKNSTCQGVIPFVELLSVHL